MTNPGMFGAAGRVLPTVPRGDVIGTYETYPEAQAVVERLSKTDFPVDKVSIVGSDLKSVERVTGRVTWGSAAARGAISGLWFGIFLGILLSLFSSSASYTPIIAAALLGAAAGLIFGLISHAVERRRRDFTSSTAVLASTYQVIVAPEMSNRAQNLLANPPADS